jgi:two-component system sensor histidine kinase SenX3
VVSAVTNLLDNAIKYSDEHHQVDISARRENGSAVIEVRDRGIGIPTKDLERVFERFYRVDPARSRSTGGTGLGLSIVRHIAQVHSGEVTVTSREGEGSTFKFVLPIIDAADGAGAGDGPTTNGMAAAS